MASIHGGDFGRVVGLEAGVVMVVTDLHGDWEAYCRYRDHFLGLQARGQADYLVLAGDLIHSEGPPHLDRSLDMVLDVLALQKSIGERLVYLLGNHELPHIYGISLAKGQHLYTPSFEAAMGEHRAAIISLFDRLHFYVHTKAGVSICHAGASSETRRVLNYSHRRVLEETRASLPVERRAALRNGLSRLNGEPYEYMARHYLAVSGPEDPRYDDLLIGTVAQTHADFEPLWTALFTRNEQEYGRFGYPLILTATLRELSTKFHSQTALVSGHMACQGGYTLVTSRHLRLASGVHAYPRHTARYLLFDAARPVQSAEDLLSGLKSIFDGNTK